MRRAVSSVCAAIASALSLVSCGGTQLRGGSVVAADHEWLARPRIRFVPAGCRDGRGQPAAAPELELQWLALGDGRKVWVQARNGYDAVIVSNAFRRASGVVWQLIVRDQRGPARLHEISRGPSEPMPRWSIADEFDEAATAAGLPATPRRIALHCNLQRLAANGPFTARPAAAAR